MKIILITLPDFHASEADEINSMFDAGLPLLHVRKPKASLQETEDFILKISPRHRAQIVIHNHFSLIEKLSLRGAHLGAGRTIDPRHFNKQLSFSCHTINEVKTRKHNYNYVFLSPIFNSLSKKGYTSPFTADQLTQASLNGTIDHKVFALGGITPSVLPLVGQWHFGGVALLGDVWQHENPVGRLQQWLSLL